MFVWLASGGVHAIFDALELETESEARPWWKKRLLAIATCLVLSVAVAALALLGTGLDWIRQVGAGVALDLHFGSSSGLWRAVRFLGGGATLVLLHVGLYKIGLPRQARRRLPLWPGAILAVVLEALLGFGYGIYLSRVGTESAYQASLSVIAVTMITLWLLSTALLVGAGLNRQMGRLRSRSAPPDRPERRSSSPVRASVA
jgi:membrane protein